MSTSSKLKQFQEACTKSNYPVALSGAGLSSASGIPTFRGVNGLWRSHDPLQLATPEAFLSDPNKVWQFYHYRRELCLNANPNKAHQVLNWLSTSKGKEKVFPNARELKTGLVNVTQNVDGLLRRAQQQGSEHCEPPLEMHGSLFKTICTRCRDTRENYDSPIAASLAGTETIPTDKTLPTIPHNDLPRCQISSCNGLLRPGVVWFGESIPLLDEIGRHISRCDLLLVLGTSSTVYPASGFAGRVINNGGTVAVFNLETTDTNQETIFFQGPVEDTLPEAVGYSGS
ncbi:unnamed protein product [Sympodiomycopsis kandeliae]